MTRVEFENATQFFVQTEICSGARRVAVSDECTGDLLV